MGFTCRQAGFVERVIVQGGEAVDRYLEECRELGFDVVEVSSGLAPIPLEDKLRIMRQVQKLGMKPKPEVTMMIGAGAGTHVAGYEAGDEAAKLRRVLRRGVDPPQSRRRDDND